MDDLAAFSHRFCVTKTFMRQGYLRSYQIGGREGRYVVCDQDGTPNDKGDFVMWPSGKKIVEIKGHCDYPKDPKGCNAFLYKNPDKEVLPPPDPKKFIEPEETMSLLDKLEALLLAQGR